MRERQIKGLAEGLARLKARVGAPTRALRDRDVATRSVPLTEYLNRLALLVSQVRFFGHESKFPRAS